MKLRSFINRCAIIAAVQLLSLSTYAQQQQTCVQLLCFAALKHKVVAPTVAGPVGEIQITVTFSGAGVTISGVQVGSTYRVSTCNGTSDDTYLFVLENFSDNTWCDDDACGQQSEVDITPTLDGSVNVFIFEKSCGAFSADVTATIQLLQQQGGGNGNQSGNGNGNGVGQGGIPALLANTWKIDGNSGLSSTDFIGTTDATDLVFKTNGVENMRLHYSGNTGSVLMSPETYLGTTGSNSRLDFQTLGFPNCISLLQDPSFVTGQIFKMIPPSAAISVIPDYSDGLMALVDNNGEGTILLEVSGPTPTSTIDVRRSISINGKNSLGNQGTIEIFNHTGDQLIFDGIAGPSTWSAPEGLNINGGGVVIGSNLFTSAVELEVAGDIRSSGSIDAGQYLLNGSPLQQSQWTSSGNDIYYSAGKVGIGTANPSEILEVDGNISVSGILKVGSNSIIIDASAGPTGAPGPENHIYINSGSSEDLFINSSDATLVPTPLNANTAANTILNANDNNGRVGIGTTSPQKKLHVKTIHTGLEESHNGIRLEDVSGPGPPNTSIWDIEPVFSSGIAKLDIGTPGNPLFTVTEQGNVGIGTTSPSEKLTIKSANNAVNFGIERSSNTNNVFEVVETSTGAGRTHVYDANGNLDIFLATDGNVYFNNSGNVGFGTTNPITKLHVENDGNVRITLKDALNPSGKFFQIEQEGDLVSFNDAGIKQIINMNLVSGNVGIGTNNNPESPLEINSVSAVNDRILNMKDSEDRGLFIVPKLDGFGYSALSQPNDVGIFWNDHLTPSGTGVVAGLVIAPWNTSTAGIRITAEGNVGIGTSDPGSFKLAVEGKVGAREFKVTLQNPWPDYVFSNDYHLMPMSELEEYIRKNGHLPEIPSALDLKEDNGINLGDMQIRHMKKTEELYLYVIELNGMIRSQEVEINKLKKIVSEQRTNSAN